MDKDEDYDSSDDEDYVPPAVGDDDEEDFEYDDVDDDILKNIDTKLETTKVKNSIKTDDDDEKKRIDSLWADFLDETNSPASSENSSSTRDNKNTGSIKSGKADLKYEVVVGSGDCSTQIPKKQQTVTELFDFAGETVEVERVIDVSPSTSIKANSKVEDLPTANSVTKKTVVATKRRGSGLANAAAFLSKKKKMSVLDKTSHDWKQFVTKEGIEDDLQSHNRSKDSFLDKQDFLLKADYSQFEEEKALRQLQRSKNK